MNDLCFFQELSESVRYCKDSGLFFWRKKDGDDYHTKSWNTRYSGKECGKLNGDGYIIIAITRMGKRRHVQAHRLAWFVMTGSMPFGEIDHIDQNRRNNKIDNLRDVSASINMRNASMRSNNKSGAIGVCWRKQKSKWAAYATINKKQHFLGLFSNIDDAKAVVAEFRSKHGFTDLHGSTK